MYNILALVGPSGSGKDSIKQALLSLMPTTNNIIGCTTRPIREGEVPDQAYHFISREEFAAKVCDTSMIEATCFKKDWFYGTTIDDLKENTINIGVFNPAAIDCLMEDSRLHLILVYVNAPDKIRLMRSLQREDNPDCHEICRRFFADETDFNFSNMELTPDIIIDNDGSQTPIQLAQNLLTTLQSSRS